MDYKMGIIKYYLIGEDTIKNQAEIIDTLRDDLKDKDKVIAYQKELIQVQSETVKQYRKDLEELKVLKNELEGIINEKNTKRKSTRLSKKQ